jgi:biopolymer transport protein ExbD
MIDVLLVLLIIFMAALPSTRKSIDVQLPDQRALSLSDGAPSIVLEIDAQGRYSINKRFVARDQLAARLHAIYDARPDKVLFVKGDGKVKYSQVVDAMDVARGAGVRVLGMP